MCPLQRLRPMPASGFRVPIPVTWGRKGIGTGGKFENFKKCNFFKNDYYIHFKYILSLLLCPVPCLHFVYSFCLET
ncbi:unnamed protein product [Staurois parvus]|uniref:Uncharacterized protein n=1 Tax=Staurois parvus TaxID=386267 RepID=A0ABN9HI64_9NEOB|nr:unnamed protein product [Staurois parvus]